MCPAGRLCRAPSESTRRRGRWATLPSSRSASRPALSRGARAVPASQSSTGSRGRHLGAGGTSCLGGRRRRLRRRSTGARSARALVICRRVTLPFADLVADAEARGDLMVHRRPRRRLREDEHAHPGPCAGRSSAAGHSVTTMPTMLNWLTTGQFAMATVTAFEAKTRFGELLERVSRGEEVVITRHDRPVARLVPEGTQRLDEVRRSVEGLRDLQQRIRRRSKVKLTDREVRAAIDRGRL